MLAGNGTGADLTRTICCAIADDKASERLLTQVVKEVSVWEPAGLLSTLHLLHVALVPANATSGHVAQVQDFMQRRFVSILDQLPEELDWQLHVVTISRSNYYGDDMRGNHNPEAKKLLAGVICRQAEKYGATELVVNEKDHNQKYHKNLAHKVIKYSKIQVRVISSSGKPTVHQGKGVEPKVLVNLDVGAVSEPPLREGSLIPQDKTDVYSRYKAVKRGINRMFWGKDSAKGDSRTTYTPAVG